MRIFYKLPALLVFFILSINISAQTYSNYSDIAIILKSDTSTRSALISNLLEDKAGDVSPIIGAAAWTANNKKLQCRSLLSFDYGVLPKMISPEQIIEAQLILKPVEIATQETMNGIVNPKIIVRRILQPWEDSTTSWSTQPESNLYDEAIKKIKENKKNRTLYIDVTSMVRNMFRYGNNGFMIRYEDSLQTESFLSQWFASARFEDEDLRPELLIKWSVPMGSRFPIFADVSPLPSEVVRQYNNNLIIQPVPSVKPEPVNPPVVIPEDPKPKGNNN